MLVLASSLAGPSAAEQGTRQTSKTAPAEGNIHALISRTAKRHGVEPALVHAVVSAESAYNPKAVSRAGAIGLMQVMPATAVDYGVPDSSALFDPAVNVNTGVRHLKRLLRKYRNDYGRVIMAYNAGEGVVDRTGSSVPYAETLGYTEAVIRRYRKLGGTQPTDAVLREVIALRGKRGQAKQRRARPSEPDPGLLLPKVSPRLEVGNLLSSPEPSSPPGSPGSAEPLARVTDRSAIRGALRTGIDPVIRQPAPAPAPGTPAGRTASR